LSKENHSTKRLQQQMIVRLLIVTCLTLTIACCSNSVGVFVVTQEQPSNSDRPTANGNSGRQPIADHDPSVKKNAAQSQAQIDVPISEQKRQTPIIDIDNLIERLRNAGGIGFLTKLSLKNQVDRLLEHFSDYHNQINDVQLEQLREQFNLLFLKVISLLQDADIGLSRDVASSREGLWFLLSDRTRFSQFY